MRKKKKEVVYKSNRIQGKQNDKVIKYLAFCLSLFCLILTSCIFLIFPLSDVVLPSFYFNNLIWTIIFGSILVCVVISLMIVINQGANNKTLWFFICCAMLLLFSLVFSHIFKLLIVSLFLSVFILYFAFLTFHELHKTNLRAYYLFLPFVLFSIFNVVVYYFLVMLN